MASDFHGDVLTAPKFAKPYSHDWLSKVAIKDEYETFARKQRKIKNVPHYRHKRAPVENSKFENNHKTTWKTSGTPRVSSKTNKGTSKETYLIPLHFDSLPNKTNAPQQKNEIENKSVSEHTRKKPHHLPFNDNKIALSFKVPRNNIAFEPPVASVVDFHEAFHAEVLAASRNAKNHEDEVMLANQFEDDELISPSRVSNTFMANFLGIGAPLTKNSVTSFRVKPILPPINGNKNKAGKLYKNENFVNFYNNEETKTRNETDENLSRSREEEEPNYFVYHPLPHHNHALQKLQQSNDSPKLEAEEDFNRVVRWKNKARYPHRQAMFRRLTSPTLGEKALRKKLSDGLPSRRLPSIDRSFELHVNAVENQPKSSQQKPSANEKRRVSRSNIKLLQQVTPAETTLSHLLTSRAKKIVGMKNVTHHRSKLRPLRPGL